jgi:hypothetical protein
MYWVAVRKDAPRKPAKAPESVRILFDELAEDLEAKGPIQPAWPNFS